MSPQATTLSPLRGSIGLLRGAAEAKVKKQTLAAVKSVRSIRTNNTLRYFSRLVCHNIGSGSVAEQAIGQRYGKRCSQMKLLEPRKGGLNKLLLVAKTGLIRHSAAIVEAQRPDQYAEKGTHPGKDMELRH